LYTLVGALYLHDGQSKIPNLSNLVLLADINTSVASANKAHKIAVLKNKYQGTPYSVLVILMTLQRSTVIF
jgi:hypothetical protein